MVGQHKCCLLWGINVLYSDISETYSKSVRIMLNCKVNYTLALVMKAQREGRGIALSFL